jgi:GNAT superfamily N-acetyltransferase
VIRAIEERAMNAWPSVQTLLLDGWVLRFANGYTRRANSVNPIYPGEADVEAKIQHCERLYRAQGLPVVFKLTEAVFPPDLDSILAAQGYAFEAGTSVQTLDLRGWAAPAPEPVDLAETLTESWFAAFSRMSAVSEARQVPHRQILRAILSPTCYVSIRSGDQVIACGLGVADGGYVGLFDIVTDPGFRRQGFGQRIVTSLLAWGINQGAHTAYLQVMINNDPALRLYARSGFSELYRYWYRVTPGDR